MRKNPWIRIGNCRGEEFRKTIGYIRVGISQGNIRWHYGTSGRERGNALESVIHQTEVKWQIQENNRLQMSQQCYEQDSFQDEGCQGHNEFAGSGGLRDYLKQGLRVQRPSIWLHPKSADILYNSENGYQFNQGETKYQDYNVHGRSAFNQEEQVKTGVRYYPSCRNVEEIVLENIKQQMPNEYKDKLRIPGLDL
ncbi:MAG: hypothetical protein EZS28_023782 [Streblomastix strix]|uniref:Uncharacterized protein n=1 Tax=Streblomastix strix TaxID=222440 RepID=A0A5J4VDY9_9EUKA|nr:MAG: hypothetical protein EZS28_023782 [Streblomastix strix]